MRITLAAALLVLGCSPVETPTDAAEPDAPLPWEVCPPAVCAPACSLTSEISCGEGLSVCAGCEARCNQVLWDAASGDRASCTYYTDRPTTYACGDPTDPIIRGGINCYRRRF